MSSRAKARPNLHSGWRSKASAAVVLIGVSLLAGCGPAAPPPPPPPAAGQSGALTPGAPPGGMNKASMPTNAMPGGLGTAPGTKTGGN